MFRGAFMRKKHHFGVRLHGWSYDTKQFVCSEVKEIDGRTIDVDGNEIRFSNAKIVYVKQMSDSWSI